MPLDKKWPLTLKCADFGLENCCQTCHEDIEQFFISMQPPSAFSGDSGRRMPDFGLGIHAEVCCGIYHDIRALPRSVWLRVYARNHGWSAPDIEKFISFPAATFHKQWGEMLSKYWALSNPNARQPQTREDKHRRASSVVGKVVHRSFGMISMCPKCAFPWNKTVCTNCKYKP